MTELEKLRAENAALQEQVARLRGALLRIRGAHNLTQAELEKLSIKVHGDLYGCDCEGQCNCKPSTWYDFQALRHHLMGTDLHFEEALSSTLEPRMLIELRAARDGLAECAADTETHDGCRGCKKDLTRLDAFLKEFE